MVAPENLELAVFAIAKVAARPDLLADVQECLQAEDSVIERYGPSLRSPGLHDLSAETIIEFLQHRNNKHWTALERQGPAITSNMPALRQALGLLGDTNEDLAERYDASTASVKGLGRAIATALLHVAYPQQCGAWNTTTEAGMERLSILPKMPRGSSPGQHYAAVNDVLLTTSKRTGLSLWALDAMWYQIASMDEAAFRQLTSRPLQIREPLAAIMDSYLAAKEGAFAHADQNGQFIREQFSAVVEALNGSSLLAPHLYMEAHSSVGFGKWANCPHISIRDSRVTQSGFRGVYIGLGFRADMTGFVLGLVQGEKEAEKQYGKEQAGVRLRAKALKIAPFCANMRAAGFKIAGEDSSKTEGGVLSPSVVGEIAIGRTALPDDETLENLLAAAVADYAAYVDSTILPKDESAIWIIGPGRGNKYWEYWKDNGIAAIDFVPEADLAQQSRDDIKALFTKPGGKVESNNALACFEFAHVMEPGDRILARSSRNSIGGWGYVTGSYRYDVDPSQPQTHVREVDWIGTEERPLGWTAGVKTLTRLDQYDSVREQVDQLFLGSGTTEPQSETYTVAQAAKGLFVTQTEVQSWVDLLEQKRNVLLQGPPGVGKTFVAKRLAKALIGADKPENIGFVQFHQSYSYEDFIQGYRPNPDTSGFALRSGRFVEFCDRARQSKERFVFIIDEINRGNLSKIFGELMVLIESDKRQPENALPLMYAEEDATPFYVPQNVYLLGMMNTADRSLAMVDYALRRRFAFIDLTPQFSSGRFERHLAESGVSEGCQNAITVRMKEVNDVIASDGGGLGPGYRIGHSYFCAPLGDLTDREWYDRIVDREIAPLLREYWRDGDNKAANLVAKLKSEF